MSRTLFQQRDTLLPWLLCLLVGIVYCCFSMYITGNIFHTSDLNDYIYLLDAFVHGRVNVTPPATYDLSLYHGKWYLYWGPAPVLVLWPFYLIWGLHASDVLYTLLGGVANVVLMYLCIRAMKRYFGLALSPLVEGFLLLSFALASPNFFLSLTGRIWFTSQIFATTYLLLFYLCLLTYLTSSRLRSILLATMFFCLACLTRYSLIFHGLLLVYALWESKVTGKQSLTRLLLAVGGTIVFFVCLGAAYNYLKFQNILEVGQRFQQGSPRYDAIIKSGHSLSRRYFWYNVYYYFINPIYFSPEQQLLKIDQEGNSVFMVYPALLLLPVLCFKVKRLVVKERVFLLTMGGSLLLTTAFLMLYFATGWRQFGNRYFFDALPLCFLLLAFVVASIPRPLLALLLLWGVVINCWGILAFFGK